MIAFYSGTPGSGKSLFASGQVLSALFAGKLVITNYPITLDLVWPSPLRRLYQRGRLRYCSSAELTPDYLIQCSREFFAGADPVEGKILLVIDEGGLVFNPRDWQDENRRSWLAFFPLHRKLGFDVIIIAQNEMQIDKQIRPCFEVEYKFRSSAQFVPVLGWLLPKLFCYNVFFYGGIKSSKNSLQTHIFRYHRNWGRLYDTMRLFGAVGGTDGNNSRSNFGGIGRGHAGGNTRSNSGGHSGSYSRGYAGGHSGSDTGGYSRSDP